MRTKSIQVKHIDKMPVLNFLRQLNGKWATMHERPREDAELFENSVWNVIPAGTPYKVGVGVMYNLVRRGLVSGCTCGCRGDFEITQKGLEFLELYKVQNRLKVSKYVMCVQDLSGFEVGEIYPAYSSMNVITVDTRFTAFSKKDLNVYFEELPLE